MGTITKNRHIICSTRTTPGMHIINDEIENSDHSDQEKLHKEKYLIELRHDIIYNLLKLNYFIIVFCCCYFRMICHILLLNNFKHTPNNINRSIFIMLLLYCIAYPNDLTYNKLHIQILFFLNIEGQNIIYHNIRCGRGCLGILSLAS